MHRCCPLLPSSSTSGALHFLLTCPTPHITPTQTGSSIDSGPQAIDRDTMQSLKDACFCGTFLLCSVIPSCLIVIDRLVKGCEGGRSTRGRGTASRWTGAQGSMYLRCVGTGDGSINSEAAWEVAHQSCPLVPPPLWYRPASHGSRRQAPPHPHSPILPSHHSHHT